ncbi:MAG: hypothetical protein J7604_24065 [Sporocytophaga sp.]|uniref:hypothetical protein n=1 Tax=Sporocytophaga sp. TaxID=2231183 RepID=UPI001B05E464|nr:hypothetical protein [Sporocytophaga sp.]MBO9703312.1 hypothetical protein [Sporocytophaga sp.]
MFGIDKNKGKNGQEHQVKDQNEVEQNKESKEKGNNTKTEKPKNTDSQQRPLQQVRPSDKSEAPDTTATLQPVANAEPEDWLGSNRDPDVMLSVPNVGIDHIGLNVKNLHAHVDLNAKVLDLVQLHVGADIGIEEVDLQIDNVRVQAMLKVKLEKVRDIVGDVVGLLDNHPEILSDLTGGLGRGLEGALARKPSSSNQLSSGEKDKLRKLLQKSEKSKESKKNQESNQKTESNKKQESDEQHDDAD